MKRRILAAAHHDFCQRPCAGVSACFHAWLTKLCVTFEQVPCCPQQNTLWLTCSFQRRLATGLFTQGFRGYKSLMDKEKGRLSTKNSALYYYCYLVLKDL
jgi:hypothetical protein